MYSLNQLVATDHKRQWMLMDTETCLPLLYPLRSQSNLLAFTSISTSHGITNAARFRAVVQFISFLINTYVSPVYRDNSPKALSLLASQLRTRLRFCRENYRALTSGKQSKHSHQGFQSMTSEMMVSLYRIIAPCTVQKHNPLNPFPAGNIQYRNFLIIRLLLNYGLRIGELLLLACNSIKSNIKGDKFSLIVTTTDEGHDPREHAPSLKNVWANRVLELDKQDYNFLNIYIEKMRPKTDIHDFIFTSSQGTGKPLSYTAIHSMFSKIDDVLSKNFPEYKSQSYFDALQRFSPHVTRHTWAYLTLKKIYYTKYLKNKSIEKHSAIDLPVTGLMEEAKDELRLMGGWSPKSQMPDFYAKRFLSQQANTANIQRIAQDNIDLSEILDVKMEGYHNESQ
ncbi:site-specific integrase [Escherichia albertii]|uniref:site-specific integrase n=1 Tax=Escherichia albertii TaxID=208962 RepID=UPI001F2A56B7|nr:site-specific integrase [Escherichia albertii]MCE7721105.1 site-specific integrase [Escherichia albertii]MCE7724928.1 site-specific integrase [Escherichia albertii]